MSNSGWIGCDLDGTPVFPSMTHSTSSSARQYAARNLGAGWEKRGYKIVTEFEIRQIQIECERYWLIKKWFIFKERVRRRLARLGEFQFKQLVGIKPQRVFGNYVVSEKDYWKMRGLE